MTGPPNTDVSTNLAAERTYLAAERTMLSWVRTATSLITFGFSVYKFFQIERHGEVVRQAVGADTFAIALVVLGLASLVLATFEYRASLRRLSKDYPREGHHLALVVAGCTALLGLLALVLIVYRK